MPPLFLAACGRPDASTQLRELLQRRHLSEVSLDGVPEGAGWDAYAQRVDARNVYYPPQRMREVFDNESPVPGWFGLHLIQEGPNVFVTGVESGSPAQLGGLTPGALLLSVDGAPLRGVGLLKATRLLAAAAGEAKTLGFAPADAPKTLKKVRLIAAERHGRPVHNAYLHQGVGILQLQTLTPESPEIVARALGRLKSQGARAFILDLRASRGGDVEAVPPIVEIFLPRRTAVVSIQGRAEDVRRDYFTDKTGPETATALAVLISRRTAGEAEVLAGALQAHGRALVFGEPSAGDAAVFENHVLNDGSGLRLLVGEYVLPAGRRFQKTGLQPDVAIPNDPRLLDHLLRYYGNQPVALPNQDVAMREAFLHLRGG